MCWLSVAVLLDGYFDAVPYSYVGSLDYDNICVAIEKKTLYFLLEAALILQERSLQLPVSLTTLGADLHATPGSLHCLC